VPVHLRPAKDVVHAGQAAIDAYKEKRKNDKPSEAKWIFPQALLQHHAYMSDPLDAESEMRKAGRVIAWTDFSVYWLRFMVAARFRCKLRARMLRKATRPEVQRAGVQRAEPGLYARSLLEHKEYWADVDEYLSADDLPAREKARQRRTLRRWRYLGIELSKGCAAK